MSLPPLDPKKTTAGIAVDPHTLERVIPESRRPDGTYVEFCFPLTFVALKELFT